MVFLDPVNRRPLPSLRLEFDPASFGKGANGRYIKKRKMGKTISEERPSQLSQKLKIGQNPLRKEGWHRYDKS
jgi:hypothetical protein